MKIILQFALASLAKLDMAALRRIWDSIERLVSGFELSTGMTGQEKLDYVVERVSRMIPENRRAIGPQIVRAVVELVLISIRIRGSAK